MFKTLIVEDNKVFRRSLNEILSTRFPAMTISEAEDANNALRQVGSLAPNLVLTDIKLPDGNGLNLTRIIKADHADAVVIIITSNDIPEYRQAAYQAGASYFIPKDSFASDDILGLVESIVSLQGMQEDHRLASQKLTN